MIPNGSSPMLNQVAAYGVAVVCGVGVVVLAVAHLIAQTVRSIGTLSLNGTTILQAGLLRFMAWTDAKLFPPLVPPMEADGPPEPQP